MAVTSANALTSLTRQTGTAASSGSGADIAGNFQQFLLLLTTQLKNQSPLDPLDTNQFTQQLVQFAGVEQQLKTNSTLASLAAGSKASTAAAAAGLVGSSVTVDGASTGFANGSASWTLNAAKAGTATFTITDATGVVVATATKAVTAGAQNFTWDGRLAAGGTAAAGTYRIAVSARDAAGQPVSVATDLSGTVGSVDMSGESPVLVIGTSRVPITALRSIGG